MNGILAKIIEHKKAEVAEAKARVPLEALKEQAGSQPRCRNFYRALTKRNPRGVNVIGEIKRASPSAGTIRRDFDPQQLALTYERCGADAISVLTDEKFFAGRLEYVALVKQAVSLPVLRKDFIVDAYQIYEARAAGADAVLLIAEAVVPAELMDLMILAASLTLTVLLEVHQLDRLLQVRRMVGFPQQGYSLLGINNRDLDTMEVDLGHSVRMSEFVDNKSEQRRGVAYEGGLQRRTDRRDAYAKRRHGGQVRRTVRARDAEMIPAARERPAGERSGPKRSGPKRPGRKRLGRKGSGRDACSRRVRRRAARRAPLQGPSLS